MKNPMLSIVVGTRNRPDAFRRLVESIEKYTPMPWELVVSDASDRPIENEPVATDETWPKIKVIPERPRLGHVKGYNRAFREARGGWVIWLNDDVEVLPDWADNAITFMEYNPHVGLGALYYEEPGKKAFHMNLGWGIPYANFGILRREVGERIGWFDEDFYMYGADNAIAFEMLMAGYAVVGIHSARVRHHSVNDPARQENERDAQTASAILSRKYEHRIPELRRLADSLAMGVPQ